MGTAVVTDGGTDESELIREWTVFISSLLATIGIGIGLIWVIASEIGLSMYEPEVGDGSFSAWGFSATITAAMIIAVFVGVFLAWRLGPRASPMNVAAVSVLVGTFGLLITRLLIRSTASSNSVAFDGVLVNSLVTALVAAGGAVVSVWIAQHLAPTGSGLEATTTSSRSGHASD